MAERAKQYMRVYGYMKAHGSITQNQATADLSCTDLAGAIYKLKKTRLLYNKLVGRRYKQVWGACTFQAVRPY